VIKINTIIKKSLCKSEDTILGKIRDEKLYMRENFEIIVKKAFW